MMNIEWSAELVFFILLAVVAPFFDLVCYPRLERASAERVPGARPRYYLFGILFLWASTACVFAIWLLRGRPWAMLGLTVSSPPRLGFCLMLFGGYLFPASRRR